MSMCMKWECMRLCMMRLLCSGWTCCVVDGSSAVWPSLIFTEGQSVLYAYNPLSVCINA